MRASVAIMLLAVLVACGGGSNSTTTTTSGIKNRALVTNTFNNNIEVVDASLDALSVSTISLISAPTLMTLSPAREITMVFNSGSNQISVIDNTTETSRTGTNGSIQLPNWTDSMIAQDANVGYAAVRNASVTGQSDVGAVLILDLKNIAVTNTIPVPRARHIVLTHDNSKLLVFSDNSDAVTILTVSSGTTSWDCVNGVNCKVVTGFNRPVLGFVTSDNSSAFVLNCGPECGGASGASVQVLNLGAGTAGTAVPVSAATTGLLNSNTLIVAGTRGGLPGAGLLTALDVSSGTPVVSRADVPIGDGTHTLVALTSNNKLFIGATGCTNNPNSATPTGCLSVYDIAAGTASIDTANDPVVPGRAKGFVTGMAALSTRNVVYVVEGGELRVFDSTTGQEMPNKVDIVGQAFDVKLPDQS